LIDFGDFGVFRQKTVKIITIIKFPDRFIKTYLFNNKTLLFI